MWNRDAWLFAALGWDPTWQRRVPARTKVVWTIAVALMGIAFGALALLGSLQGPPSRLWIPLVIMVLGLSALSVVQALVRREVLGRLDTLDDERAAQRIQSRLLPATLPQPIGFELAAHYSPFRLVGGDFYDAVSLGDTHLLLAMADVSGKGTPAALLTANLQAILHFAQSSTQPPEAVAAAMNAHLARHTDSNRFVTMVLAVLDVTERRLRYVNAGHNPPLLVAPDGTQRRLEATGVPLGMLERSAYTSETIDLPRGSMLLLYTDGLSERADASDDLFGEERIATALRSARERPAQGVVDALVAEAERFASGTAPADDVAVLVLRSV